MKALYKLSKLFILISILAACTSKKSTKTHDGISIGETSITHKQVSYVLMDDKKFFNPTSQSKDYTFQHMENRINKLIDDLYLFDYALELEFDKNEMLLRQYENSRKHYALQEFRLHKEKKNGDLEITEEKIKKAYEKLKQAKYVTYIHFIPEKLPKEFSTDKVLSPEEFEKLLARDELKLNIKKTRLVWPYKQHATSMYSINMLKTGQISEPVKYGNSYIFYRLDSVVANKGLLPYNKVRNVIKRNIKVSTENSLYNKKLNEIAKEIDLKYNENSIAEFIDLNKKGSGQLLTIEEFEKLQKHPIIATYNLENKSVKYQAKDLRNHSSEQLFENKVQSASSLKHLIKVFIVNDILYQEILNEGYLETDSLKTEFKNIKMRQTIRLFEKEEIDSKINITANKIRNAYTAIKDTTNEAEYLLISRFDFADETQARKCYFKLKSELAKNREISILQNNFGAYSYLSSYKLAINDISIPNEIKYELFAAPNKFVTRPMQISGEGYTVIIKHSEEGNRNKTYAELKPFLEKYLYNYEKDSITNVILTQRKELTPVKTHFSEQEMFELIGGEAQQ